MALLVSLGTLILALAGLELGLRLTEPVDLREFIRHRTAGLREASHPDLAYELVPGAAGQFWGTTIAISSQGLRDREYSVPKPPGVTRICVLGDSVAFANGLPAEDRFSDRLEERLAGAGVEVLNLAVGGYDVLDNVARLEDRGLAFEPDLVLMAYCINDAGVQSANRSMIRASQRLDSDLARLRTVQWLLRRLERASGSLGWQRENADEVFERTFAGRIAPVGDDARLMELVGELRAILPELPEPPAIDSMPAWYTSPVKLGRLRHCMERLARHAHEQGFEARVALMPYLDRPRHPRAWELVSRILEHECTRVGIPMLDTYGSFADLDRDSLRTRPGDGVHLNPRGHEILARVLEDWLAPWLGQLAR